MLETDCQGDPQKNCVHMGKKERLHSSCFVIHLSEEASLQIGSCLSVIVVLSFKGWSFVCDSLLPEAVWYVFFSLLFLSLQARNHKHFNFPERFHMHKHVNHPQRNRLHHVTVWPLCGLMCVLWYWVIIVYFCSCLLATVQHQPRAVVFIRMFQLWH